MLCALLCFFLPQPWYYIPSDPKTSRQMLCRGWLCNIEGYHQHQFDEFSDVMGCFLNGTLNNSLSDRLYGLINRGFEPAKCAIGFLYLFGLAGFPKNLTKSYNFFVEGKSKGLWPCYDALSIHPLTENREEATINASKLGAVWSTVREILGLSKSEPQRALDLARSLMTSATPGWWKKRRSGPEYSESVKTILGHKAGDKAAAWSNLLDSARLGNLPAAIWVAEGYTTGEIGSINPSEGLKVILPFVIGGPWKIDIEALIQSNETFDSQSILRASASMGDEFAASLLSYPPLLK